MMRNASIFFAAVISLSGCGQDEHETVASTEIADKDVTTENVLPLEIVGMSFSGPSEVRSGWTTIRINNNSGMTHHGLVYKLPEGITEAMVSDQVVKPIQAMLTANIEGDVEKAAEIWGGMPSWLGEFLYLGGPGMMSDGIVGEATMYLEPGEYLVECYVKTNGVQHNYNPVPGQSGMVKAFTVTAEPGGMPEPEANVTLAISNTGYVIENGEFTVGENSVRVRFDEQQLYNNFVGHDAHFFQITPETNVEASARWVDFFPIDGQQTPAPAKYVGGIHDMPQGSTAYIKLQLEAGDYGIVAEIPNSMEAGLFKQFSVPAD